MSYLERLRAKISPDGVRPELTKPTKPGCVSFVSAPLAPSRQISAANDPKQAGPDLPLLAASIEYHALIERLMCTEDERQTYHRMANGISPEALLADLPKVRELVKREVAKGEAMPRNNKAVTIPKTTGRTSHHAPRNSTLKRKEPT